MKLNPFELRNNNYYVKDLYKESTHWHCIDTISGENGNYEYLLKNINTDVNWEILCYTGYYSGYIYCLGKGYNKYYYIGIGYGSCTVCDVYQSCNSIADLQELQDSLKSCIREFDTLEEFIKWFNSEEGDNVWDRERDGFLKEIQDKYPNISI